MPYFTVSATYQADSLVVYNVNAGTSGKAINIVLAHLDAVVVERTLHSIHCSPADKEPMREEARRRLGVIALPAETELPRHVERG